MEVILDDNQYIHTLAQDCKGRGTIATMCGGPDILNIVAEAKLSTYDTVAQVMDTASQEQKQVEYRKQ